MAAASEPYVALELSLPDELVETAPELAPGWRSDLSYTRALGSDWLGKGAGLALLVPSALVAAGAIVLLNPAHAAADRVEEFRRLPFEWDERLL